MLLRKHFNIFKLHIKIYKNLPSSHGLHQVERVLQDGLHAITHLAQAPEGHWRHTMRKCCLHVNPKRAIPQRAQACRQLTPRIFGGMALEACPNHSQYIHAPTKWLGTSGHTCLVKIHAPTKWLGTSGHTYLVKICADMCWLDPRSMYHLGTSGTMYPSKRSYNQKSILCQRLCNSMQ